MWHTLKTVEVEEGLCTDIVNGLAEDEVKKRQEKYGKNVLKEKKKESIIVKFVKQFNDFMIIILIIASIISAMTSYMQGENDYIDSIIIIAIVILIVLIAGVVMLAVKGFNKGLVYQESKRIEVSIPKGYDKKEVKDIANEVFSNNVEVQDIEKLNQIVSIRVKSYTDEELENFETKIAEKYGIEKDDLSTQKIDVPTTRIEAIVSPYVFSVTLVTVLSLVYIVLKNIKKKDVLNKVIKLLLTLIVVAGLYFSIILITRIPVNEYMMPVALTLYVGTLLITVEKLNKKEE